MSARLKPQAAKGSLFRAAALLSARLDTLEDRLEADELAWSAYCEAARALAAVAGHLEPGARGELLTTQEMAQRLGLSAKTLRRHVAGGVVKPALHRGKLIRWRGDEVPR